MVFSIESFREPDQTPINWHHELTKTNAWHHQKGSDTQEYFFFNFDFKLNDVFKKGFGI